MSLYVNKYVNKTQQYDKISEVCLKSLHGLEYEPEATNSYLLFQAQTQSESHPNLRYSQENQSNGPQSFFQRISLVFYFFSITKIWINERQSIAQQAHLAENRNFYLFPTLATSNSNSIDDPHPLTGVLIVNCHITIIIRSFRTLPCLSKPHYESRSKTMITAYCCSIHNS